MRHVVCLVGAGEDSSDGFLLGALTSRPCQSPQVFLHIDNIQAARVLSPFSPSFSSPARVENGLNPYSLTSPNVS